MNPRSGSFEAKIVIHCGGLTPCISLARMRELGIAPPRAEPPRASIKFSHLRPLAADGE